MSVAPIILAAMACFGLHFLSVQPHLLKTELDFETWSQGKNERVACLCVCLSLEKKDRDERVAVGE